MASMGIEKRYLTNCRWWITARTIGTEVFDLKRGLRAARVLPPVIGLVAVLIFATGAAPKGNCAGISLAGTSGLINIPTAEVISDQQMVIGFGYMDRHAAYLGTYRYHNYPFFIVLGYLPRLEFSAGVTFVPGQPSYDGTNTYKDGVISLQYLLINERGHRPSIAVGARDIYSFILLNTTFVVASKTIVSRPKSQWRWHVGYGFDFINRHLGVPKKDRDLPVGHTIVGAFWGMEISWNNRIFYLLEYDTQKINAGLRWQVSRHFNLCVARMDMEHWSASLSWIFHL